MARMKPELRKQEIIDIAFRQFLESGYSKTSIRSIVGEANGEIGMFYHHFSSKEEIFTEVLEHYNKQYIAQINTVISERKSEPFIKLLDILFLDLETSLCEYANMNHGSLDDQMLLIIHRQTLASIQPILCELLDDYIKRGEISPPEISLNLLADFLLYGISAVIHDQTENNIKKKENAIRILIGKLLDIP